MHTLYGGFLGLCYLTQSNRWFIADRFFRNRNCILLGGLMMAVGQFYCLLASVFGTNLS
jgi:POT family proton-dependent oligopeptide transporter